MRYTLWGTAKDKPDWAEDILLTNATVADIRKVTPLAEADGFRNIRKTPEDSAPIDFAATVRRTRLTNLHT